MIGKFVKALCLLRMAAAGAQVHRSVQLPGRILFGPGSNVRVGKSAWFEMGAALVVGAKEGGQIGRIEIGDHFYCNRYAMINACDRIVIGSRVQIGPFVYIADFDHDLISRLDRPFHRPVATWAPVKIEDEVWVGAHAVVLKGVTIGRRSVVAAGAVVTRNVPPDTVVAGVPARVIKNLSSADRLLLAGVRGP